MKAIYKLEIKARWQGLEFIVTIPKSSVSEYILNTTLANFNEGKALTYMVGYHNLLKNILERLKYSFEALEIIAIESQFSRANYVSSSLVVKLNPFNSYKIQIFAPTKEALDHLIASYQIKNLGIKKLSHYDFKLSYGLDGEQYIFESEKTLTDIEHQSQHILVRLQVNDYVEEIYLSKTLLQYVYEMYYPTSIGFVFDKFHIELAVNRINLMFAQFSHHQITINSWSLGKLPLASYQKVKIKHHKFNSYIFFREGHSYLLDLLQNAMPAEHGEKLELKQFTTNFSVISHYINSNIEEINRLKKGDVFLSPIRANKDECFIELGDTLVVGKKDKVGKVKVKGFIRK